MGTVTHNFDMDQRFMNLSLHGERRLADDQRAAERERRPARLVHGVPGRRQRRAVAGPDRPGRRGRPTRTAPTAPGSLTARRRQRRRQPELERGDRQRRRHRVPRVPLDDVGLHAVRGQPHRDGQDRHDVPGPRACRRDLLLPRAGGRRGRQPRRRPRRRRPRPWPPTRRRRRSRSPRRRTARACPARSRSPRRRPTPSACTSVQFQLDGQNLGARGHEQPVLGQLEHEPDGRRPAHADRGRA